jgi:DNA primase
MFPIRDARGRAIAFGGRAMDPNARAKYLNSPETELFDKGRNLYNLGPARAAVAKGQPLVVAEGYLDVIALSRAGFGGAVAPLGTAVTEDQIALMWRVSPEPIIALDGDKAGLRAAYRLIDLALPLLSPERALRFVILPEGKDPDDLIRSEGRGRMEELLANARPLVSLLWQRETEGRVLDSPERKAALDKALRAALRRIADASVRSHYTDELRRLRAELLSPPRSAQASRGRRFFATPPLAPVAGTRASMLAQSEGAEDRLREAVILATLVVHPVLVAEFEAELEGMEFHHAEYRALSGELLRLGPTSDLYRKISENLGPEPLENLFALRHVQIAPPVRRKDDAQAARLCLTEEFAKLDARRGVEKEIAEAAEDLDGHADEGLTWRLAQAASAMDQAVHSRGGDKTEYDIAPSGARIDRKEREAFDALIGKITRDKGEDPA